MATTSDRVPSSRPRRARPSGAQDWPLPATAFLRPAPAGLAPAERRIGHYQRPRSFVPPPPGSPQRSAGLATTSDRVPSSRPRRARPSGAQDWPLPATAFLRPAPAGLAPAERRIGHYQRPRSFVPPPPGSPQRSAGLATTSDRVPSSRPRRARPSGAQDWPLPATAFLRPAPAGLAPAERRIGHYQRPRSFVPPPPGSPQRSAGLATTSDRVPSSRPRRARPSGAQDWPLPATAFLRPAPAGLAPAERRIGHYQRPRSFVPPPPGLPQRSAGLATTSDRVPSSRPRRACPSGAQDWPLPATAFLRSRPRRACPSGAQDWPLPATAFLRPAPAGLAPAERRIGHYQRPRSFVPPPPGSPQRSAGLATTSDRVPSSRPRRARPSGGAGLATTSDRVPSSRPRRARPSGAQDWPLPATAFLRPAPAGLAPAERRIGHYQRPRSFVPPPPGLPQRSAGLATTSDRVPSSRPRRACPSGAQDWPLPATAFLRPAPAGLAPAERRIGHYQRPRSFVPPPPGLPQRSAGLATTPTELPPDHTLRTCPHNSRSRTPVSSRRDRPNYS